MSTRYRLPAVLGGGEYDGTPSIHGNTLVHLNVPSIGGIDVPRACLTEVKPPLPPEPSHGGFALVEAEAAMSEVYFRRLLGDWWEFGNMDQGTGRDWAELHRRGKVTVLVRDPAADAPTLPFNVWDVETSNQIVTVEPSEAYVERLFVEVDSGHLQREHVRQLASVLWAWAAAREVEQP